MNDWQDRTRMLIGQAACETLLKARVAVFGIGGVGGYVCEALVRSGIGTFDLIDNDTVSVSNINRQIIATTKTIGRYKVDVMKERMLEINPAATVHTYRCFFLPGREGDFPFGQYDYIVDAVDTVPAKLALAEAAAKAQVPVISSMGAGNKLMAGGFKVADIYDTKACPLARVMRRELKKRAVTNLKVVYSEEIPIGPQPNEGQNVSGKRQTPGSIAFVPSIAGILAAAEVVKDLISTCNPGENPLK